VPVSSAKGVSLVWNDYCPFTCVAQQENGKVGYAMEIVAMSLSAENVEVDFIRVDSWLRAMELTRSGAVDGIVFSYYPDDLESQFLHADIPLSIAHEDSFLVLKEKGWRFEGLPSLYELPIFATYDTNKSEMALNPQLRKYQLLEPSNVLFLSGSDIVSRAISMLQLGRLNAWLDSEHVLNYAIKKYQLNDMTVEHISSNMYMQGGVLLNRDSKQAALVLPLLNKQFGKMLENGQFAQIQTRYGINSIELNEEYLAKQNKNADKMTGGSN
jgi:polar amino acid transport system substrate-binding protein